MRKADIVLVVLAVIALVGTAVAGLTGDRWTDERVVHFTTRDTPLAPQGGAAGASGAKLNWTVPANSTKASLLVSLSFSGQSARGGVATVTVRVTTPDGKSQPPVTQAWTIPQGATSAQTMVNTTVQWAWTPADVRDTSSALAGQAWAKPLQVLVVVERPPGDLPVATYSFAATAQGTVTSYRAA